LKDTHESRLGPDRRARGALSGRVVWEESGGGFPVVFIHGLGNDRTRWAGQVRALSPRYRTITFDNMGHGESVKPPGPYDLGMFVDFLHAFVEDIGLERFALVGFSLGGLIAAAYALDHPRMVAAIAIFNSVHGRTEEQRAGVRERADRVEAGGPGATLDTSIERWYTADFRRRPDSIEDARRQVLSNDRLAYAASYRAFADSDPALDERIRGIDCPALIMTAENDIGSTPEMSRRIADSIPDARLEIVPRLRHCAPMEDPEIYNRALISFLDEIIGPAGAD
jgi:pimeloyl-ACP methyl ester carboxylesterase